MPTLKDILLKDAANAKTQDFEQEVLAPGEYVAKIIAFVEEDTYQYLTVEINKKRYNFFYNYYLYESTDLDANLISWIKALATIPTTEQTSLLDIANSAIGSSYKITLYNYVPKSGKNQGKTQCRISFKDLPVIETVTVEEEDLDLPY
jgi:hypothetical protein